MSRRDKIFVSNRALMLIMPLCTRGSDVVQATERNIARCSDRICGGVIKDDLLTTEIWSLQDLNFSGTLLSLWHQIVLFLE